MQVGQQLLPALMLGFVFVIFMQNPYIKQVAIIIHGILVPFNIWSESYIQLMLLKGPGCPSLFFATTGCAVLFAVSMLFAARPEAVCSLITMLHFPAHKALLRLVLFGLVLALLHMSGLYVSIPSFGIVLTVQVVSNSNVVDCIDHPLHNRACALSSRCQAAGDTQLAPKVDRAD